MSLYQLDLEDGRLLDLAWRTHAHATLPLLFTVDLVPGRPRLLELTLGPIARVETILHAAPSQTALFAGGVASASWHVAPRILVMLEGVYLHPVYDPGPPLVASHDSIGQNDPLRSPVLQVSAGGEFIF